MINLGVRPSRHGLDQQGIPAVAAAHWNFGSARLLELAVQRHEGMLTGRGALAVRTGQFTGRSPKDKYIVRDPLTESTVAWGSVNQPMSTEIYDGIWQRALAYLSTQEVLVQDLLAGADPEHQMPIRIIAQRAWHGLFARQLFIRPKGDSINEHNRQFSVIFLPDFHVNPATDGTRSETAIIVNFTHRVVLIAGTCYAGEMKKSVFTILNHLLPEKNILPMHCSANIGEHNRVALFFGLSGTGKTTLSAERRRKLIGDDEHGWNDRGVFNFEGGCYAKCIRLSREAEPQIYNAIRYGVVLENVVIDPETRSLDFNSEEYTENTRAAYRIHFVENAKIPGVGGHPTDVVFLTADAFGVLPPVAKLTNEQAMYHFLSGYTARLAGTERGLGKEPQAVFSSCFGEPFLPRSPQEYARLLGDKLKQHKSHVWLINTGWTGGPHGIGHRMDLAQTRAMVTAAIEGELNNVPCTPHPIFQVHVPNFCPGVPKEILDPRLGWSDKAAYDASAHHLATLFKQNFDSKFSAVDHDIAAAGPLC
ncbi:MAG TPA: phosphoenolpyruvate carboxykinase (ATP) [Bryobacteraceae bacterium]|nr:phosphoenolpyruvate carboxykinase (ATP) [Bryobacteraceae bacterium]